VSWESSGEVAVVVDEVHGEVALVIPAEWTVGFFLFERKVEY
jgi:uncharacterized membrane protein